MDTQYSFGKWLQKRRKALDLTREELAKCAGCSKSALQKIEGDERRPSKQLAELLAVCLKIPSEDIPSFIKIARGGFSPGKLNLADPLPTLSLISELPSPDPQTNLPVPPTQLVGREPELVVLSRLLRDEDCRLVTLVGPGGIGKTRLAIETAMTHQDLFAAGAYFVSLSPLNTPDFIVDAVAGALQLAFSGPADPKTQLLGHLGKKQILLVLDNFEHLMEGAGLVAEILQRAPAVKMIATSREQLNLQGEWLFELQGLPVPESDAAEIESNSAVALFIQSARRAQVGYQLKVVDHPAVVRICKLVEGMPLGIELAAAWVGTLSCQEIAQEIERSLDFLSMSRRDMPDRHRSLRAVFEHSWRLLSKDEQSVM